MSSSDRDLDQDLVQEIARSGEEHAPPQGWEEQVWRRTRGPAVAVAAPKRSFAWPLAGVAIVALAVVIAYPMQQADNKKRQKVAAAQLLKKQIEWEQEIERTMVEIDIFQMEMERAFVDLETAQDEAAKMQAIAARKAAKAQLSAARARLARLREENAMRRQAKGKKVRKSKKERRLVDKCAKSNDPLCGL
jgi:hypothetical protein